MIGVGKHNVTPVPSQLLKLVPRPEGINRNVKGTDPDPIRDTVPLIMRMVKRELWQGKKLAAKLKGSSLLETLRNDWNFIFDHIQYVEDGADEMVRSLRRLIYDGKGDCDCFVSALSNLLLNQRIHHFLRVARYDGSLEWSHIYIVVPVDGNVSQDPTDYITMDCVPHQFNYEVPYTDKKDFAMKLQHLDGIAAPTIFVRPSYLRGLGCGCGNKSESSQATPAAAASTDPTERTTQLIPLKQMYDQGLMKTTEFLAENNIPYTVNDDFTVSVPTKNGSTTLETFVPMSSADSLYKELTSANEPEKVSEATGGISIGKAAIGVAGFLLLVGGIAALRSGLSAHKSAAAMNGVKKKKSIQTLHL